MRELYRGYHIFQAIEQDMREVIVPVAFPFDFIELAKSANGCTPGFQNREPKFIVTLRNGNKMWLMGRFSDFTRQWDAYLCGGDDEPAVCHNCQAPVYTPYSH